MAGISKLMMIQMIWRGTAAFQNGSFRPNSRDGGGSIWSDDDGN